MFSSMSLDILRRHFTSPGGSHENSPAVHCRVQILLSKSRRDGRIPRMSQVYSDSRFACLTSLAEKQGAFSEHDDGHSWDYFSRPFGTYAFTDQNPAVNCRAIFNSPFGRNLPEILPRRPPLKLRESDTRSGRELGSPQPSPLRAGPSNALN